VSTRKKLINKKEEARDTESSEEEQPPKYFQKISPNVLYTQVRRIKIIKDLMPH